MRIIVLFNLRHGISVADYEKWAVETDIPIVNGLGSIKSFTVHKMDAVLGSDAPPPYQYIEIVDVEDETLFGEEVAGATMQRVAAEFQKLADNPTFIKTSQLGV